MSTVTAPITPYEDAAYQHAVMEAVAQEVRAAMGRKRYTQTRLAALTGISQTRLSRRLSGEVPFDILELDRVAAALGVRVVELVSSNRCSAHLASVDGVEWDAQLSFFDDGPLNPDRSFRVLTGAAGAR